MVLTTNSAFARNLDISANDVNPIELSQFKTALRIVTLANGSTEVVSALGLRSAIVGRDIASTSPEFKSIPIVTSGHQVIAEKVISLKPDLVIVDPSVGPKTAIDAIKRAKIEIFTISEAWTVGEIHKKIAQIGKILGQTNKAQKLNALMNQAIGSAKQNTGWKPKMVFLYLRGPSSIYLLGGKGSGADSLINSIGGIDVGAKNLKNPFSTLTSEALVAANPDVILVMTKGLQSVGGESGLLKLPGVAQTNAGKYRRILSVDDSLLLSFGPRTPALLLRMSEALRAFK